MYLPYWSSLKILLLLERVQARPGRAQQNIRIIHNRARSVRLTNLAAVLTRLAGKRVFRASYYTNDKARYRKLR